MTALCLKARDIAMHEGYPCVHYASRDGWLPSRVHAVLQEKLGGPEGVYFHAGRRAYFPFMADSFIEYARTRKLAADLDSYTLEDLLRGHFSSEADQLLALLTKRRAGYPVLQTAAKMSWHPGAHQRTALEPYGSPQGAGAAVLRLCLPVCCKPLPRF